MIHGWHMARGRHPAADNHQAPGAPFEGRFWSYAGLRGAQAGQRSTHLPPWTADQTTMPLVTLFADTPHEISLEPPDEASVAAFLIGCPRCIAPQELHHVLTPDQRASVEQAMANADRLARLVLERRGTPARGGTTKPLKQLRDALCDAVRQGLERRLGARLTTSEEQVFAYFTSLAAMTLPASVRTVPPHGNRVCEVCARVFAARGRSKCPTCRQNARTRYVVPDPREVAFLTLPAPVERSYPTLPIEDLNAFGGIAAVRQGIDQLPSEERFVLAALYGLDEDKARSVERVARWFAPASRAPILVGLDDPSPGAHRQYGRSPTSSARAIGDSAASSVRSTPACGSHRPARGGRRRSPSPTALICRSRTTRRSHPSRCPLPPSSASEARAGPPTGCRTAWATTPPVVD